MTQEKMSESAKNQENMGSLKKKCAGMNCESPESPHSPECIAQHAAAAANGKFVPHSQPSCVGEIHRFRVVHMLSELGNKISYKPHGPEVVMAEQHDAALTARDQQLATQRIRIQEARAALDFAASAIDDDERGKNFVAILHAIRDKLNGNPTDAELAQQVTKP